MPLKNNHRYCLNHPDVELTIIQLPDQVHMMPLAVINQDGYAAISQATGLNAYSCKICGYVEFYLIESELASLKGLTDES